MAKSCRHCLQETLLTIEEKLESHRAISFSQKVEETLEPLRKNPVRLRTKVRITKTPMSVLLHTQVLAHTCTLQEDAQIVIEIF